VPESDAAALKAEKVDLAIAGRIAAANDDKAMYADQRRETVEKLLTDALTGTDPAAILEETRNAHTTLADDGKKQFDALAYTEALRSRLASLGAARADNVRRAILESSAELGSRITVDQSVAIAIDDNNRVRMKLTLQVQ
jgi:hypothetical protein